MARVLLLALLVAVWASSETASSLNFNADFGNVSSPSSDSVDGKAVTAEKRMNEALDCPDPFQQLGNGCYFFGDDMVMPWDEARTFCQALGSNADLAVLDDCYQFQVVWNYILVNDGHNWHWIGANDRYQEGSWHWVNGDSVPQGTPFWYPGKPDGYGDCLCLSSSYGYFLDYNCENSGRFVCQMLY